MTRILAVVTVVILLVLHPAQGQTNSWTRFDHLNDGHIAWISVAPNGDLLAATDMSGVYRSKDMGVTWEPISVGLNGTDSRVIAATPNGHLFTALNNRYGWYGGSDSRARGPFYTSTNGGTSWDSVALVQVPKSMLVSRSGQILLGDIGMSNVGGIKISIDEGRTWEVRSPNVVGEPETGMNILCIAEDSVGALYVSFGSGLESGIKKSLDYGITWAWYVSIPSDVPWLFPKFTCPTICLGNDGFLYAGSSQPLGVYRLRTDGSGLARMDSSWGPISLLRISNGRFVATDGRTIRVSDDSCRSWTTRYSHDGEIVGIVAHPSGSLFAYGGGSGGHLVRSTDHGTSWQRLFPVLKNTFIPSIVALDNSTFITGARGTVIVTQDAGLAWGETAKKTSSLNYNENNWRYTWGLHQMKSGALLALIETFTASNIMMFPNAHVGLSKDKGQTWKFSTLSLPSSSQRFAPRSATSTSEGSMFVGTDVGVFRNTSDSTWTWLSSGPIGVRGLAVGFDQKIYAATSGQGVFVSSNLGGTWTQLTGFETASCYSIAVDSSGSILVGTDRECIRWEPTKGKWYSHSRFSPRPVQSLAVDQNGITYAGTATGVLRLNGTFWEDVSQGLSPLDVTSMGIKPDGGILAGTWGGGLFKNPGLAVPTPMHFTTVANSPILSDMSNAKATVWGDYDNDGDPDLFVVNGGGANNQLYRYDGWPTGFTKIPVGTLVNDGGDSRDAAWGDYDNDGFVDLVVVNYDGPPCIYHNNANGSFTKVIAGPIATDASNATGVAWADYDNDGRLDLFISRTNGLNNSLFHNEGNGSFTKIASGEIVTDASNSSACAWGDYDNDGYVDLFVGNTWQKNLLYHNNGNGTFSRAYVPGTMLLRPSTVQSCGWIDIDNDGDLDLWISNGDREPMLLYRNEGNGSFSEIFRDFVWTDATTPHPVAWGDFDNDGDVDFFIAGRKSKSAMYLNDGTGQFTRLASGMPMLGRDVDGPASWADYSGDGNLDLLVANSVGPRQLFWSDGIGRSALRIRCAGTLSDSRGVGARVAIKATIGGKTSWYYRTATGRDDLSMHFGLGDATTVDSVVVRWPITGVQVLAPVAVDANITITEPSTRSVPILLYPAHRSSDIPTTTMLRWRSSAGASVYHLQVSTDTLFSALEYNDSTLVDTTKNLGPFALSTNYFWRVRAKGSFLTTPWTDTWRFTTVMPVPDSPVLASPAQGAGHQLISGFLSWRVNSRASRYHVQMATDSLFSALLVNDSTLADTSRTYSGDFDSRYYWHVRAINGSGSSVFSGSRAFNTVLPPPLAPVLKGPTLNSNIESPTATLTWIKPSRGEQYQLQVAYDSLLTTRFLNDSALTDTTRGIPVTPGKSYYWRVRASGEGGFGPYSSVWSFNSILATPIQTTPLNNAMNLPRSLTLKWHPVAGAETYRLQVSTDSTLAGSLLLDDSMHVDTTATLPTLGEHIQYFWRVRAQTESVSGVYSPVWRFRTALGIPGLAQPSDKALNQPISVSLAWHPVGNATGYHLQVASNASLDSGIVVNDSLVVDTTRVMSGLLYNTQYYWRVKGRTLSGSGEFSPAWWFRTVQVQPSKPELSHPLNNLALNTNVIAFVWRKSTPDVSRYWHELSTDSIFFIKTMDSTLTDTTYLRTGIPNGTYWWRVRANNSAGWGAFSDVRKFSVTVTGIDDAREIPTVYSLDQNYPNPFNPSTIIRFGLPAASHVSLIVFNTLGQEVKRFLDEPLDAGYHMMQFDGARLSSGVYFYRLRAGNFVDTKRFLLIK